jgi:hypothetical protein
MLLRRFKRKIIKAFFREQWSLLVCTPQGEILKHIVPPKNHIWADPFPIETENKTYIFIEQQIGYEHGTLGYIELYSDLSYSPFTPVLEKGYHLSFPHIFSAAGADGEKTWYLVPESHKNKTIDLYRANNFPGGWTHEMTLMDNVVAVDSSIFYHNSNWWLFTGISSEGSPMNRNLSAFYSKTFPSNSWTPHPQNPLCENAGNSRMAGAVFLDKVSGKLMRPAQSCIKEYGEKTNINEIVELSEVLYREKKVKTILPEKELAAVCTHTFNFSEKYLLRDIKTRVFRYP